MCIPARKERKEGDEGEGEGGSGQGMSYLAWDPPRMTSFKTSGLFLRLVGPLPSALGYPTSLPESPTVCASREMRMLGGC